MHTKAFNWLTFRMQNFYQNELSVWFWEIEQAHRHFFEILSYICHLVAICVVDFKSGHFSPSRAQMVVELII